MGEIIARSSRWPEAVKARRRDARARAAHLAREARAAGRGAACRRHLQPPARAAVRARAPLGPLRGPAGGDEGPLAPARAHAARAGPRRSDRVRRSGGPRRLPERRGPVDRGLSSPTAPRGLRRCSRRCTRAWDCRVRSELCRPINPSTRRDRNGSLRAGPSTRCDLVERPVNTRTDAHEFQSPLPSLSDRFPRHRSLGVRQVPRTARGHLRLRHDRQRSLPPAHREPAREPLALPRAAAHRRRAADGPALRVHAARARAPAGGAARRPRTVRQGRLGRTIRRVPTRIASSRSRRRARSSSGSPSSRARRPGTSREASPRTPRAWGSPATSSSPTISKPARSPAPASTGRASSPSAATTTM